LAGLQGNDRRPGRSIFTAVTSKANKDGVDEFVWPARALFLQPPPRLTKEVKRINADQKRLP
jgi:hypothetical protein